MCLGICRQATCNCGSCMPQRYILYCLYNAIWGRLVSRKTVRLITFFDNKHPITTRVLGCLSFPISPKIGSRSDAVSTYGSWPSHWACFRVFISCMMAFCCAFIGLSLYFFRCTLPDLPQTYSISKMLRAGWETFRVAAHSMQKDLLHTQQAINILRTRVFFAKNQHIAQLSCRIYCIKRGESQ
jgi:hypothetical protein